ncbi:unnamed protein product [Rotaria magnacalcarata]
MHSQNWRYLSCLTNTILNYLNDHNLFDVLDITPSSSERSSSSRPVGKSPFVPIITNGLFKICLSFNKS